MSEVKARNEAIIENMIYEIRGKQVMLDSDLASLYECSNGTKTINLEVKRHANRFTERFMFRLKDEESENIGFKLKLNMVKLKPVVENITSHMYLLNKELLCL